MDSLRFRSSGEAAALAEKAGQHAADNGKDGDHDDDDYNDDPHLNCILEIGVAGVGSARIFRKVVAARRVARERIGIVDPIATDACVDGRVAFVALPFFP